MVRHRARGRLGPGTVAGILAITLTFRNGWTEYAAWERAHAYDSPIHPLFSSNWPDPAWMHYKKAWYIFGTNNAAGILSRPPNASDRGYGAANIQLGVSNDDLATWSFADAVQQPLPHVGAWADSGLTRGAIDSPAIPRAQGWSPGIIQRKSDKRFVLYYAAATTPPGLNKRPFHCIGAALSPPKSPQGPFEPLDHPLVCDVERGGAIDPSPFRDKGGAMWLAYSESLSWCGTAGNLLTVMFPQRSTATA